MFDSLKKVALVRLSLRFIRAHERIADALEDVRDHLVGDSPIGVNRDAVDDKGNEVSYSNDSETFEAERAEREHFARYGAGSKEPFGV